MQALDSFLSIEGMEDMVINAPEQTSGYASYQVVVYYNQPCISCNDVSFLQYLSQIQRDNISISTLVLLHPDENARDINNLKVNYGIDLDIKSIPKTFKEKLIQCEYYRSFNGLIYLVHNKKIVRKIHFGETGPQESMTIISDTVQ